MYVFIDRHRGHRRALLFAAAYLVTAIGALSLTSGVSGIAAIWPASGVMLAGVLLLERRARRWLYVAVFFASLVANTLIGSSLWIAAGFSVANIAEGWMGRRMVLRLCRPAGNVADARNIGLACIGAAIAAVFSAIVAAVLTANLNPGFLISWSTTVFFGMVTIAPALLFLSADWGNMQRQNQYALAAIACGLIIISAITFRQDSWPLLWLPIAATGVATYRLGLTGAAISLLILAIFVCMHSSAGIPLPGRIDEGVGDTVFLQIYLVGALVSVLPVASLLDSQRLMVAELTRLNDKAFEKASEAQRIAETDVLTGVANRVKATAYLADAVARAIAEGTPLSLMMIDVDHFKSINDRFGHVVGDKALIAVAGEGQAVTDEGLFARIGGEEFLLALPGRTVEEATVVAEQIQHLIRARDWTELGLDDLTLSIGVAQHSGTQDVSDLLAAADYHLYVAKRQGRDCVRAAA